MPIPKGRTGDYRTDIMLGQEAPSGAPSLSPSIWIPTTQILLPWQNALARARAGTGIGIAWNAGASTAAGGSNSSNVIKLSTFAQLRQSKINAGYPVHSDFFTCMYNANAASTAAPNGWPFQMGTGGSTIAPNTWQRYGPWWLGLYTVLNNGANPLMQAVFPHSLDLGYIPRSARIYYWDTGVQDGGASGAGQSFSYRTAWGGTLSIPNMTGSNSIKFFDVVNAPATERNTVDIMVQTAAGSALIIGASFYPTTTPQASTYGICWARTGMSGHCLGDLGYTGGTFPSNKIARYMGTSSTAPLFVPDPTLSPPFAPDLVMQEEYDDGALVGVNTATFGVAPTAPITPVDAGVCFYHLGRMHRAWRRKATGCTVVHAISMGTDNEVGDVQVGLSVQNAWQYVLAHIQSAQVGGAIVIQSDMDAGGLGATRGWQQAANPHPTDEGAKQRANRWQEAGI